MLGNLALELVEMTLVWKHFCNSDDRRKNALNVQQHHLDRPGENGQLLLEEIAGHRECRAA